MPAAQNIRDLFAIREHNRLILDAIENVTGTALGRKNGTGDPAVLVFVARKIASVWLQSHQVVPTTLTGPLGQLTCPTDVVSTETDRDFWLRTFRDEHGAEERDLERFPSLVDTDRLQGANLRLRDQLRGAGDRLTPGSRLGYRTLDDEFFQGTLACFARHTPSGREGFLTNYHVGEFGGNTLWHPGFGDHKVGTLRQGIRQAQGLRELYGVPIPPDPPSTTLTVDAAFCELHPDLDRQLWEAPLPTIENDRIQRRPLGPPLPLDPTTMGPVGRRVVGVGGTRGEQKGTVEAVGVDYIDDGIRFICDYLIVGENNAEFSDPGDSGKLIVTEDRREPLAIMWGGTWARWSPDQDLQNFTDATDIGRIMNLLEVEILDRI